MAARPGQNRGTRNIKSKLCEADVIAILKNRTHKQAWLADRYRVSQSTISLIKSRRRWVWLVVPR